MRQPLFKLLLALSLLCSCRGADDRVLSSAEALITTDPAKATHILDSLDYSELSDGQKARHTILSAELDATLGYEQGNPERLDSAITYYSSGILPHKKELMIALLYKAIYERDRTNYQESMKKALEALSIAREMDENLWSGRIHTVLKNISEATLNLPEMQENASLAASHFRKIDSLGQYQFAVMGKALAMSNLGNPTGGLSLIDSMYAAIPYYSDFARNYSNDLRAEMLLRSGHPHEALKKWETIPASYMKGNIDATVTYGNILIEVGMLDSCETLINETVEQCDSSDTANPDFLFLRSRLAEKRGDYKTAFDYYVQSSSTLYDMVRTMMENSAMKYQSEFYMEQSARRKKDYEFRRNVYVAIFAAVLMAIAAILLTLRRKMRRRRTEMESLAGEMMDLRKETAIMTDEIARLRHSVEAKSIIGVSLENMHADMVRNLGRMIEGLDDMVDGKTKTYRAERFASVIGYLNEPQRFKTLEQNIDRLTGNIFADIRKNITEMKERDIRASMLHMLGLSRHGIATFMGLKYWTLCSSLNRMRIQIRESSWERKEEFLGLLDSGLPLRDGFGKSGPAGGEGLAV